MRAWSRRHHNQWLASGTGLASIAALVLVALTGCGPATGTLEVRLTDHRVAIGDFESLTVTLTSVDIHPTGAPRTEGWLSFAPQTPSIDLTEYLDDAATVLVAELPPGDFDAARLVVAGGEGQLKAGGTAHVPGFQEAAALRFAVRRNQTTVLLFDLVVQSADDHPGGGYETHLVSLTNPSGGN